MEDNDASIQAKYIVFHHIIAHICFIHSIPIDMKVPLESKSEIFLYLFSLIVHAGRCEISSEIKF